MCFWPFHYVEELSNYQIKSKIFVFGFLQLGKKKEQGPNKIKHNKMFKLINGLVSRQSIGTLTLEYIIMINEYYNFINNINK